MNFNRIIRSFTLVSAAAAVCVLEFVLKQMARFASGQSCNKFKQLGKKEILVPEKGKIKLPFDLFALEPNGG